MVEEAKFPIHLYTIHIRRRTPRCGSAFLIKFIVANVKLSVLGLLDMQDSPYGMTYSWKRGVQRT